jgi:hypothetical protein
MVSTMFLSLWAVREGGRWLERPTDGGLVVRGKADSGCGLLNEPEV